MISQPMDVSHLDRTIAEYHAAVDELMKGSAAALKRVYSHHDDASLASPFGPVARGSREIENALDDLATYFHDGRAGGYERVAAFACSDLAYIVEKEELRARLGPGDEVRPFTLRVTTVLRREEGDAWKVVHRHADSIVAPLPPDSVIPAAEKVKRTRDEGPLI